MPHHTDADDQDEEVASAPRSNRYHGAFSGVIAATGLISVAAVGGLVVGGIIGGFVGELVIVPIIAVFLIVITAPITAIVGAFMSGVSTYVHYWGPPIITTAIGPFFGPKHLALNLLALFAASWFGLFLYSRLMRQLGAN